MTTFRAVIGAGFGDEGKGLVTSFLAATSKNPIVVRYSGGHNAGHTVDSGKCRHVFSNFGSGTLYNVPTYWSHHCTMHPTGLVNEFEVLKSHGISPSIYIDKNCKVTTPYEIAENRRLEALNYHGSVGVGFGSTIQREEDFYSLTFLDLFYEKILKEKLKNIAAYYQHRYLNSVNISEFLNDCKIIRERMHHKNVFLSEGLPAFFDTYIFEGSQGLLLDQNIGFFPNVTRSNTGTKNIAELVNSDLLDIYLVTRAYQTRHGNGFMTNEEIPHKIKKDKLESNVTQKYQGKFRRSILDVSLLEYGFAKDIVINNTSKRNLVITCLDHIQNQWRFTYNNEIIVCKDEDTFIKKVGNTLKADEVFISKSPFSSMESLSIQPQVIRVKLGLRCSG